MHRDLNEGGLELTVELEPAFAFLVKAIPGF